VQGGAALRDFIYSQLSVEKRSDEFRLEKQLIGKAAADQINSGDTVILDSGTTTFYVAKCLKERKNTTIITNALDTADILKDRNGITLISTGGVFIAETHSFVGPLAERMINEIRADKLIMGMGGIGLDGLFTNSHILAVPLKQAMIKASKEIIIVADHSKFGRSALATVATLMDVHKVITDDGVGQEYLEMLAKNNIDVIVVKRKGEHDDAKRENGDW
jgi:DeoR family fructose operon transcriptional repressor